jgi:4-hydroxy-tetrahydrodipicolinate reductase
MGSAIARLVLEKEGLELVGVYARRAQRAGLDVGPAIGLARHLGLSLEAELAALIDRARPQVAIQATCSTLADAAGEFGALVDRGVNVISIAGEMADPARRSRALFERLQRAAMANGVAILGTGVNPGFVLDLLIITLSGACSQIDSIAATRVNDLSPYGPAVLASQGVGLTVEAFRKGLEEGRVTGHLGFEESIAMIGHALGWSIERVEQRREPIVSRVRRETPFVTVEPGQVAGCHHSAVAYVGETPVITLIHPQQVHPELEGVETGDSIEIAGVPTIRLAGSPEIPGGEATVALAVNAIPRVLNAAPGVHCMADLPVPAAILGDARNLVGEVGRRSRDG